ncbi:MAG: cupin domain-containing protein [bacterium]|nr:cupin domain-containing protein [bacterium]
MKIVKKPWGQEIWFANNPDNAGYVGKIIEVEKGHRLSLQYHKKKHETIYILSGNPKVFLKNKYIRMKEGASAVIPPKTIHRIEADKEKVIFVEVSTKHVDDVVRLQDDYNRI